MPYTGQSAHLWCSESLDPTQCRPVVKDDLRTSTPPPPLEQGLQQKSFAFLPIKAVLTKSSTTSLPYGVGPTNR